MADASLPPMSVELIRAVRAGNRQVAAELALILQAYFRFRQRRERPRAAYGRTDSDEVQDCLAAAWSKLADFNGDDPAQLSAWLGTVFRTVREHQRRYMLAARRDVRRIQPLSPELDPVDPRQTIDEILRREETALMVAAMPLLQDEAERVLHLRLAGLTWHEVGMRLKQSPEALRKRWSRTMSRLKDMLPPPTRSCDDAQWPCDHFLIRARV